MKKGRMTEEEEETTASALFPLGLGVSCFAGAFQDKLLLANCEEKNSQAIQTLWLSFA